MTQRNYDALKNYQKTLLNEAEKAMDTSYSPYSGFSVGAALLTKNEIIITGSNVENAAYGNCICAERAALVRANALGERMFICLAVICRGKDFSTKEPTAPCGSCRQMLYEASVISETDIEIILSNTDKTNIVITSINKLLPLAFGPDSLNIDLDSYRHK
jgi:cytidine deaminase